LIIDFKPQLSRSLLHWWRLQDFNMVSLSEHESAEYRSTFTPVLPRLTSAITRYRGSQFPLTAISSIRLMFLTAIAGSGHLLSRPKKDGEVIARSVNLECRRPILYTGSTTIPLTTKIRIKRRRPEYVVLQVTFTVGDACEHTGSTTLLYCAPNLKDFSYL
jgi:hypothetical protein